MRARFGITSRSMTPATEQDPRPHNLPQMVLPPEDWRGPIRGSPNCFFKGYGRLEAKLMANAVSIKHPMLSGVTGEPPALRHLGIWHHHDSTEAADRLGKPLRPLKLAERDVADVVRPSYSIVIHNGFRNRRGDVLHITTRCCPVAFTFAHHDRRSTVQHACHIGRGSATPHVAGSVDNWQTEHRGTRSGLLDIDALDKNFFVVWRPIRWAVRQVPREEQIGSEFAVLTNRNRLKGTVGEPVHDFKRPIDVEAADRDDLARNTVEHIEYGAGVGFCKGHHIDDDLRIPASEPPSRRRQVVAVSLDIFDRVEKFRSSVPSVQDGDAVSSRDECACCMCPNEASAADDQNAHVLAIPSASRADACVIESVHAIHIDVASSCSSNRTPRRGFRVTPLRTTAAGNFKATNRPDG